MAMNIIAVARNVEHLSQAALAKKLGLSRPFVVRAEQACYNEPGQVLTHYVARALKLSPGEVIDNYRMFQSSHRKETIENKFGSIEKLGGPVAAPYELDDTDKHIVFSHQLFQKWREGYWNTVTAFSVDMCVHPYSVAHYEDGDMYEMPGQLFNVLKENDLLEPTFLADKRWYYALDAA